MGFTQIELQWHTNNTRQTEKRLAVFSIRRCSENDRQTRKLLVAAVAWCQCRYYSPLVGEQSIMMSISVCLRVIAEWCPSGICWIMIMWWQRQLMVSRPNWNVNGQRRWVCFWTNVRWASGPWRSSGAAVLQVSCKCLRHIAPTIKQGGALLPEFKSTPVNWKWR